MRSLELIIGRGVKTKDLATSGGDNLCWTFQTPFTVPNSAPACQSFTQPSRIQGNLSNSVPPIKKSVKDQTDHDKPVFCPQTHAPGCSSLLNYQNNFFFFMQKHENLEQPIHALGWCLCVQVRPGMHNHIFITVPTPRSFWHFFFF